MALAYAVDVMISNNRKTALLSLGRFLRVQRSDYCYRLLMSTEMPCLLESGSVSPRPRNASVRVGAKGESSSLNVVTLRYRIIDSVYL